MSEGRLWGANPEFWLPGVSTGYEALVWAEDTRDLIAELGYPERRAGSIIRVDNMGSEIWRNNDYELWPTSINLFNPEKPYGQTRLIDVLVVAEFAERQ